MHAASERAWPISGCTEEQGKGVGGVWGGCGHLDRCCLGPVQDLRSHRRSAVEAAQQWAHSAFSCSMFDGLMNGYAVEGHFRGLTNVIGVRRRADGALRDSLGIPRSAPVGETLPMLR